MTKRFYTFLMIAVAIGIAVLVSGCVISPRRTSGSGGSGGGGAHGKLYVSTGSSILRYGNALIANTNVGPEATLSGSLTLLSSAQRIFVDDSTDRLFVANKGAGSIMIFQPASTRSGNVAPAAVITSSSMVAPFDLAIDTSSNNLLYVADGTAVLVFSGQATLAGTTTLSPVRTITFSFTVGPIFLDVANDRLYVADPTTNGVALLDHASAQSGPAVATGNELAGSNTQIQTPQGLALDNTGRLIVSNFSAPSITIYPATTFSAGGGNIPPVATISGSQTKLAGPGQILVNPSAGNSGELYVGDSQAASILTYLNIGAATGNISPTRNISGSSTGLVTGAVNGIALDTTH